MPKINKYQRGKHSHDENDDDVISMKAVDLYVLRLQLVYFVWLLWLIIG